MALARGVRLHPHLDDWLIRAPSLEEAQVNTRGGPNILRLDNQSREVRAQ